MRPTPFTVTLRLATASTILIGSLSSCGGPNFHFDPAPAPPWIRDSVSDVSTARIRAVGSAPVTTEPQRDQDLAIRDAKSRIAQMFDSQVVSRTSDWTLAVQSAGSGRETGSIQQSIEVRSNVKVEDVTVEQTYRDNGTRTQYVNLVVDTVAWLARLNSRLGDGLGQMEKKLKKVASALQARQPLTAHRELLAANDLGRRLEPDIVVIDLLDSKLGSRARLLQARERLGELRGQIQAAGRFRVSVTCPEPAVAQSLTRDVEQFLGGQGFAAANGGSAKEAVLIEVRLAVQKLGVEKVANRKEFVHGAAGSLSVRESGGQALPALAISLRPESYQERHVQEEESAHLALQLAADTVAAKFRSAFRRFVELEGQWN